MFRAYLFTEMPYPYIPPEETFPSVRVTFPSRHYDPEVGYQLYERYYDLYAAADELGLDIMLNEHHATATCVEPAVPLSMAIMARETQNARILALGNPIVNRGDPVRVAEEMAMCDVISQGRIDVGFVRGVPMEVSPQNVNPVDMKERFYEAADLIIKAWTSHDGPFNWEGKHYHSRQVNVWPRVYQEPHPPIWVPTQSTSTVKEVAERQWNLGTILCGVEGAKKMFATYRSHSEEVGHRAPPPDRLGYCGLVFVGETDEEGFAGARKLQWYLQHNKVAPQFMDVPGYLNVDIRTELLRKKAHGEAISSPVAHLATAPIEELNEGGYFFAGSPDTVLRLLERFHDEVGGFGHLLMMMHGGTMGYELTHRSMELFATEVLPRFRRSISDAPARAHSVPGGATADEEDPARFALP